MGIGFVAYRPLGRGFLSGQIQTIDLPADDYRRSSPRFQGENFQKNFQLVDRIKEIAAAKNVTLGQLALAWLLAQGDDIVPIPGTKRRAYLEENVATASVTLTQEECDRINELTPKGIAKARSLCRYERRESLKQIYAQERIDLNIPTVAQTLLLR